ncbi:MAG: ATP-binding cassette domain-containing protein [Candidatus Xenobiia bacterium LiM19]
MLELKNITKRFGSTLALSEVSLSLEKGEAAIVRGPSGCGKTTMLRLIAGLIPPDLGEIWLHGAQASRPDWLLSPFRRNIAYVFQEPRLWPHMTVKGNVMFGLSAMKPARQLERLALVSQCTGILDFQARYPSELSVGQARRVALARAIAPMRPLILMDEPMTNLDDDGRKDLLTVLQRFWTDEGFTLLYVTHDASEEIPFARSIITIEKGTLTKRDR